MKGATDAAYKKEKSMKIVGIEGMSPYDLQTEIARGGRLVVFQYCISIVVLTFKRSSSIYFIPAGASPASKGLRYTIASLLLGWWGIPWGPIYTIGSLVNNLKGGKDVTHIVTAPRTY
jgi:hypothetical protein